MPESRESREREQIEVLRSTSFTDSHLSKLQTQTTFDINIKKILSIYFHILSKNLKASLIWHCFCGTVPEKIVNTIIVAVSILGKHEAQICKKRRGPMHKTTSWSRFTAQVLGPCHCSSLFVTGPIMSLVQLCHLSSSAPLPPGLGSDCEDVLNHEIRCCVRTAPTAQSGSGVSHLTSEFRCLSGVAS
jgi:hypothetical protein